MVKKREPRASMAALQREPTREQIEAFAAGADGGDRQPLSVIARSPQKSRRTLKKLIAFTEAEVSVLERAAEIENRNFSSFIRAAAMQEAARLLAASDEK